MKINVLYTVFQNARYLFVNIIEKYVIIKIIFALPRSWFVSCLSS